MTLLINYHMLELNIIWSVWYKLRYCIVLQWMAFYIIIIRFYFNFVYHAMLSSLFTLLDRSYLMYMLGNVGLHTSLCVSFKCFELLKIMKVNILEECHYAILIKRNTNNRFIIVRLMQSNSLSKFPWHGSNGNE